MRGVKVVTKSPASGGVLFLESQSKSFLTTISFPQITFAISQFDSYHG